MRARVYSNGGNSTGGFTFNGGQLTGALILAGNPSEPLEAASKQYVDSSLVNLNASNLATGTLPSARLPSFAGDIVKPAGSSTINLAPIGITAGDYVKPTVDAKGRVTGGSVLTADDITNLSWDKITTGKPTTLAGYGINDGISLSGGTLTGFLTFNGSITGSMQAVTKQYVDLTLSSSSGIAIGDIIRKPYATTPSGFLKCNGAEISKTAYGSLYAVIGDRFSKQKHFTSGRPWQQQYNINETQSSDITGWVAGTSLPTATCTAQTIVTKNRVYVIGGFIAGVGASATVYTATINSDGSLNAWSTGTALPGVLCYSQVTIIKNRVYLFGGSTDGNTSVATVYTAPINADGTLGVWTTGTALPAPVSNSYLIVTSSKVYVCGGNNNTSILSSVYYANINSDGTLAAWSTGTALPVSLATGSVAITKNRVYIIGGSSNVSSSNGAIYTAPINSDGTLGTWTASNSLPIPTWTHATLVTKNRVYTFGGTTTGGTIVSHVFSAPINVDGTLGTWTTGTSLPAAFQQTSSIVLKNKIYLIGAYGLASVYVANISGGMNDYSSYYAADITNYMMPGSGKPWQQQYEINTTQLADITGWTTTTALPGTLFASQVIVTKNRVYMLGGSLSSSSSPVSTVYTAPINSDGTLGTWTTGTSLPGGLYASQAVVTKNRVYLLGGWNGSACVATVYTAPINSDGTLGTWTTGTALPNAMSHSSSFITKNRVYLISYWDSVTALGNILTAPINSDGTLGTWATAGSLPSAVFSQSAVITKNRVYLIGGHNGSSPVSVVYTATINSDGLISTWSIAASLPGTLAVAGTYINKNKIYLLGGQSTVSNFSSIVYIGTLAEDGTITSWITGTSLPANTGFSQAIITKNRVYLLGGNNGVTPLSTIYTAAILGGENDYSPYYDGTITPSVVVDPSTTFVLPDLTNSEKFDTVSYIKY